MAMVREKEVDVVKVRTRLALQEAPIPAPPRAQYISSTPKHFFPLNHNLPKQGSQYNRQKAPKKHLAAGQRPYRPPFVPSAPKDLPLMSNKLVVSVSRA